MGPDSCTPDCRQIQRSKARRVASSNGALGSVLSIRRLRSLMAVAVRAGHRAVAYTGAGLGKSCMPPMTLRRRNVRRSHWWCARGVEALAPTECQAFKLVAPSFPAACRAGLRPAGRCCPSLCRAGLGPARRPAIRHKERRDGGSDPRIAAYPGTRIPGYARMPERLIGLTNAQLRRGSRHRRAAASGCPVEGGEGGIGDSGGCSGPGNLPPQAAKSLREQRRRHPAGWRAAFAPGAAASEEGRGG